MLAWLIFGVAEVSSTALTEAIRSVLFYSFCGGAGIAASASIPVGVAGYYALKKLWK